jgi:hypothetical protein
VVYHIALAKDRLITCAKNNWGDECFPAVVSEIITLASPHEMELCELLSNVICENALDLLERGPMLEVPGLNYFEIGLEDALLGAGGGGSTCRIS